MPNETDGPNTFVEMVLVLLENRFPWLGDEHQDVSGADTIQELALLHEDLVAKRNRARCSCAPRSGPVVRFPAETQFGSLSST